MPPSIRFTREAVLNAAYRLVRRDGVSALNARAVAKELGGSTQPIFRIFSGMEELHDAVVQQVSDTFYADMRTRMDAARTPYLGMGLAYLRFAEDEPELFKLLFMRDRITNGCYEREQAAYAAIYQEMSDSMGITVQEAEALYARSWVYTHGLAVSIATKYIPGMSEEEMAALLTECCLAAANQLKLTLTGV